MLRKALAACRHEECLTVVRKRSGKQIMRSRRYCKDVEVQYSPLGCKGGTDCCGGTGLRQEQLRVGGHELVGNGVPCMREAPHVTLP